MVELRDEEDGRVALIMSAEELPLAVEALMRAGYGLTPPSEGGAEAPEDEVEAPQDEDEESEELEDEELEDEDEEPEDEESEDEEPEDEESERGGPVRRGVRARRLWADATARNRLRRS